MIQHALRFAARFLTRWGHGSEKELILCRINASRRIGALGTSGPRTWLRQNEDNQLLSERHISAICSVAIPATRTVVSAFASGTTVQVFLIRKALSIAD